MPGANEVIVGVLVPGALECLVFVLPPATIGFCPGPVACGAINGDADTHVVRVSILYERGGLVSGPGASDSLRVLCPYARVFAISIIVPCSSCVAILRYPGVTIKI